MLITIISDVIDKNKSFTKRLKSLIAILKERGHIVRNVVPNKVSKEDFELGIKSTQQGISYAKKNKEIIKEALKGCDVVHIMQPLTNGRYALKQCKKLGIPYTSSFNYFPNRIYNRTLFRKVYDLYLNKFYSQCNYIECQSELIEKSISNRYKSNIYVSNLGLDYNHKVMEIKEDNFIIKIKTSEISNNLYKRLYNAIKNSKYSDKIRIVSDFDIFHYDLYVHPTMFDLSGEDCLAAISQGAIPLIYDSKLSHAKEFALTEENLYDSFKVLTSRIDFWFEHPEFRKIINNSYKEYLKEFDVERAVDIFETMLEEAVSIKNKKYQAI